MVLLAYLRLICIGLLDVLHLVLWVGLFVWLWVVVFVLSGWLVGLCLNLHLDLLISI